VLERTALDASGALISTGETFTVNCDLVVRSVGYRGVGLEDAPFDSDRAVVPNAAGRVLGSGAPVDGLYVAGWIKRGPSGIIGTNKKDAAETVHAVLEDAQLMLSRADRPGIDGLLPAGHEVVHMDGWRSVDAGERAAGAARGRERTTEHDRARLLDLAAGR
jgi:ferredoxin--NADP+ reductase